MPCAEDATGGRHGVRCKIEVGRAPNLASPFGAADMVVVEMQEEVCARVLRRVTATKYAVRIIRIKADQLWAV